MKQPMGVWGDEAPLPAKVVSVFSEDLIMKPRGPIINSSNYRTPSMAATAVRSYWLC